MLLSLLTPIVLGAALHVQSDGACPAPSEVSANARALVELSDESANTIYATLKRDGAWLELELSQRDGSSLGNRRIEASDDCATLARTAAVVLVTWLSNEHPEFLTTLPSEAPAPARVPAPAPPPVTPVVTPHVARPVPAAVPPRVAEAPRTVAVARRFVLSAAIGGSAASSAFAPAAALGAAYGPVESGWGARLQLAWIGARSEPLAENEVSWTRWPVMLGPYWSFVRGSSRFELEAGAALGWLRLEGRNFSQNFSDSNATFGGYGSLRFVPKVGKLTGFVSVTPLFWFGRSTARATSADTGATTDRDLPAFELLVTGGMQLPL